MSSSDQFDLGCGVSLKSLRDPEGNIRSQDRKGKITGPFLTWFSLMRLGI